MAKGFLYRECQYQTQTTHFNPPVSHKPKPRKVSTTWTNYHSLKRPQESPVVLADRHLIRWICIACRGKKIAEKKAEGVSPSANDFSQASVVYGNLPDRNHIPLRDIEQTEDG